MEGCLQRALFGARWACSATPGQGRARDVPCGSRSPGVGARCSSCHVFRRQGANVQPSPKRRPWRKRLCTKAHDRGPVY